MGALVLQRRVGETIVVGPDVRIKVLQCNNGRVRLAIEAPETVKVDRLEVRERQLTKEAA